MATERILSTDSGKVAFEKTDRNMVSVDERLQKAAYTDSLPTFKGGANARDGARIRLERPPSAPYLTNPIAIDTYDNYVRIFEDGNGYRGFKVDLSTCDPQVGSNAAITQYRELSNSDMRNGFTLRPAFKSHVIRCGDLFIVYLALTAAAVGDGATLAVVPEGFRPTRSSYGGVGCYGIPSKALYAEINTSGEIKIWDLPSTVGKGDMVRIIISYTL